MEQVNIIQQVIIIRYAEIHLKGKNRGYFERVFSVNLEKALKGLRHELRRTSGRYLVTGFADADVEEIEERISRVFGVHSYSLGYLVANDLGSIYSAVCLVAPHNGTFKVETHRADKTYPLTSMQLNAEIGARLLEERPSLRVDVHAPQAYVYLDIRENGVALVFGTFLQGAGGMPVGTSGKGVLLISGNVDLNLRFFRNGALPPVHSEDSEEDGEEPAGEEQAPSQDVQDRDDREETEPDEEETREPDRDDEEESQEDSGDGISQDI